MKKQDWFTTWFDTPYYHVLYKERNFNEAERFISNLITHLNPILGAKVLDLACGKGRHSFFIAKQGFDVSGVDLSPQSIKWARDNYTLANLQFEVHDMREVYQKEAFDYILNFFTSFGYFKNKEEDQQVVDAMSTGLKKNGILVIDFINAVKAINNLVKNETKVVDGIHFNISRSIENGFIIKRIQFTADGELHDYFEKVQALQYEDFKSFFKASKLTVVETFGNYNLEKFDENTSDRLIMILRRDD